MTAARASTWARELLLATAVEEAALDTDAILLIWVAVDNARVLDWLRFDGLMEVWYST